MYLCLTGAARAYNEKSTFLSTTRTRRAKNAKQIAKEISNFFSSCTNASTVELSKKDKITAPESFSNSRAHLLEILSSCLNAGYKIHRKTEKIIKIVYKNFFCIKTFIQAQNNRTALYEMQFRCTKLSAVSRNENASRNRSSNYASNIRSHRIHQKEVRRIVFKSDFI